jgi:hypothetical protein
MIRAAPWSRKPRVGLRRVDHAQECEFTLELAIDQRIVKFGLALVMER